MAFGLTRRSSCARSQHADMVRCMSWSSSENWPKNLSCPPFSRTHDCYSYAEQNVSSKEWIHTTRHLKNECIHRSKEQIVKRRKNAVWFLEKWICWLIFVWQSRGNRMRWPCLCGCDSPAVRRLGLWLVTDERWTLMARADDYELPCEAVSIPHGLFLTWHLPVCAHFNVTRSPATMSSESLKYKLGNLPCNSKSSSTESSLRVLASRNVLSLFRRSTLSPINLFSSIFSCSFEKSTKTKYECNSKKNRIKSLNEVGFSSHGLLTTTIKHGFSSISSGATQHWAFFLSQSPSLFKLRPRLSNLNKSLDSESESYEWWTKLLLPGPQGTAGSFECMRS